MVLFVHFDAFRFMFLFVQIGPGLFFSNIGAFGFKLLYSMMLYSGLCFDLSH